MSALSKRSVALLLTAVLVVGSTLLSAHVKLEAKADRVIEGFYTGSWAGARDAVSPSTHLKNICGAADGLTTIAGSYGLDTEDADWNCELLKQGLNDAEEDIGYLYTCYEDLCAEVDRLAGQMSLMELSQRDASGLEQYRNTIQGARSALASSHYNEQVREFYRVIQDYPAGFLAELTGVTMPEGFDYGG